jgi:hypothetical protein
MQKTISISYSPIGNETFFVNVNYQIDSDENRITSIMCSIDEAPPAITPSWLRVKKFESKARLDKGCYTMLYNDSDYAYGLDTSLFIETATMQIMKKEDMRKVL